MSRWAWTLLGCLALAVALASTLPVLWQVRLDPRYRPAHAISLAEPAADSNSRGGQAAADSTTLRVAIAPVISPEKSLRQYPALVRYLAGKLERVPVVLQRETYLEVNELVRFGRCDLAFVCTYPFVRGQRDFGMEAIVVPQMGGAITYHSLILVPRDSQVQSLLDLQGQRFASADLLSNSGWLYPAVWLRQHAKNPDDFFSRHVIAGSHDRAVTAVSQRFVDGAAVDSLVYEQMVEDDPALAERTRTILKSPPFGMPPLVVPSRIDPELRRALTEVLLGMDQCPEGREILASLRMDRFVVPEPTLYDSVRDAADWLETAP